MTKIRYTLVEQFINEGRLEDAIKKYTGQLPEPVIKELSKNDPSGNNKYLEWMVKTLIQAPQQKNDIIAKIKCYHENVNRLSEKHINAVYADDKWQNPKAEDKAVLEKIRKTPKDINSYPSHLWIKPMCEYFEELKPKNASRVKLYEDNKWLVVSPLTHNASCSYGSHSNWCVSTTNPSYFQNYTKDGVLIFFLDKEGSNPLKEKANIYKFALYIRFDYPDPMRWEWYDMEDARVSAPLMLNLLPKNLIDVSKKYFNDIIKQLEIVSEVDIEELNEKSLAFFKQGQYYYIYIKLNDLSNEEWYDNTEFLKKYNNGQDLVIDVNSYKDPNRGLPYVVLAMERGRRPYIYNYNYVNWGYALNNRDTITNTISKSDIVERFISNYAPSVISGIPTPKKKMDVINSYIEVFNKSEITKNQEVPTTRLQLGDQIIYKPYGRRWGQGETVTITRVAEKSLLLSNGKRITRSNTSYKPKILGVTKIVDDSIRTESKWIRKRII